MQKFFGGMLVGCGVLIAGSTGLCLLMAASSRIPSLTDLLAISIPVALGLGAIYGGRKLLRGD